MEDMTKLTWLVVAALLVSVVGGLMIYNKDVEVPEIPAPTITDQDKQDIAGLVLANLPAPEVPEVSVDEFGVPIPVVEEETDRRNQREYENDMTEAKASEIALEEFNSKDFKQQLFDVINLELLNITYEGHDQYDMQIDSWRDIENIDLESVSIKDVDDCDDFDVYDNKTEVYDEEFELICDDAEDSLAVEFKFKVEYMLEDDDEEIGKARLTIVYIVEDLDFDDDFDDAQAIEIFAVDSIKLYG